MTARLVSIWLEIDYFQAQWTVLQPLLVEGGGHRCKHCVHLIGDGYAGQADGLGITILQGAGETRSDTDKCCLIVARLLRQNLEQLLVVGAAETALGTE